MIQRIQTLYLMLVVALGITLCFMSPVQLISDESAEQLHQYEFSLMNIVDTTDADNPLPVMNTVSLMIISAVIPLLALVVVFLYRKRIIQARLNAVNAFLCIGWYAILAVYVWFAKTNLQCDWFLTPWAAIPLVNLVLILMATRAILRDEALVRAADRIR